jgi:hypothetical protein
MSQQDIGSQPKQKLESAIILQNKWITLCKDDYLSNDGSRLEYWRIERSDSVIIVARQNGYFLLTPMQSRPGIDQKTLDFPGGRINDIDPRQAAIQTLRREFQLADTVNLNVEPIIKQPLFVDSAFSSQKVYGFVTELPDDLETVDTKRYGADELLEKLQCMQCRTFLLALLLAESNHNLIA